jgi:hypothetical protein
MPFTISLEAADESGLFDPKTGVDDGFGKAGPGSVRRHRYQH